MAGKPPKKVTAARLRNIALAYVQRYGGSSTRLRQVLARRAERSLRHHDEMDRRGEVEQWIAQVVDDLKASGVSDDLRQARGAAIQHALQGRPLRAIRQRLRLKGFAGEAIDAAIAGLGAGDGDDDDDGRTPDDPDWIACCRYARRRRLGPFRNPLGRQRGRDRELASLMRAGFGYRHASRVVDATCAEALQRVIDEAPLPSM